MIHSLSNYRDVLSNHHITNLFITDDDTKQNLIFGAPPKNFTHNDSKNYDFILPEHLKLIKPHHSYSQDIPLELKEKFPKDFLVNLVVDKLEQAFFSKDYLHATPPSEDAYKKTQQLKFHSDDHLLEYISYPWIEASCGEAPYLTNSHSRESGVSNPIPQRSGFLDRKLHIITQHFKDINDWIQQARFAVQGCYAYDHSGHNVIISRFNVLNNVLDFYYHNFSDPFPKDELIFLAEVIQKNIFQLDGITFTKPYAYHQGLDVVITNKFRDPNLLACKASLLNWKAGRRFFFWRSLP